MRENFWHNVKKPIFALAPMANVTDAAFRQLIAKYGKPDVMWTEFVSADGLASASRDKLLIDLKYSESERPIVAQLFSGSPQKMFIASKLAKKLKFDGIDINMGCPDRAIERSGAGAALIKSPKLAREILRSALEGGEGLPVSVKTRLGYNKDILEEWLPEILSENVSAVTVHARTRKEMSKVPARWERVKDAVQIRNSLKSSAIILGNGDVADIEDAKKKCAETGADGVMLGRAIFGNPWLFTGKIPTKKEKLNVLIEHVKLFDRLLAKHKNFAIMKKHFKAYVEGFEGARELRATLMETTTAKEVVSIIRKHLA